MKKKYYVWNKQPKMNETKWYYNLQRWSINIISLKTLKDIKPPTENF